MSDFRGKLFVISGPSGAGKGTIVKALMDIDSGIALSVSATTRAPRNEERDGEHYHFVSEAEFLGMIECGGLLEYDHHFNAYYGTQLEQVEKKLAAGTDVILEIDYKGGFQVAQKAPGDTVLVFVLPPDMTELERRLRGRGSETEEKIAARLDRALDEMEQLGRYDYIIVNDTVDQAVSDLSAIIRAERFRRDRCIAQINKKLKEEFPHVISVNEGSSQER